MSYTTINKSSLHMNTKLYTGNGGTQSISSVGFKPDFTWIKQRNGTENHALFDAVRGATKEISSNRTNVESTVATSLTGFDSDGFTLGSWSRTNNNNDTYASWNWKANGAGSTIYDGSINSTVSANTTAGFSIVSFTTGSSGSSTFGHGLGSTPSVIIVRPRNNTSGWFVYHKTLGNGNYLRLNDTDASASSSLFGNTTPTSSVFTINSGAFGGNYSSIAYCFAEKTGYSKFGSYVGNGSSDGSFCYLGFKPAFLIAKRTDAGAPWVMYDSKRDIDNPSNHRLLSNATNAELVEDANTNIDFLSNGFKTRNADADSNASGGSYIFMAFAESPLVGTNNVPCTAR